ncbi:MAG: AAA family ATPase [Cellulomonadaceae bacterium]|jgi:AAA+ ATPase superfamily predicted ATPase|nr:AAA family ATPase [Cellulomonadaceae bacterium]
MVRFIGREREFGLLDGLLKQVQAGGSEPGRAVSIRGRRRVGKSRLLREYLAQRDIPAVYFDAQHGSTEREIARFAEEIASSTLPNRDLFTPGLDWSQTLRNLALVLPRTSPAVVVIDEVPYLMRDDPGFEGALQGSWDRVLSTFPVLLILVGSHQSEMQRLTSYNRPFYQRGSEMDVGPLTVENVASLTGLGAADAIDAYLVTGGQPMILRDWEIGTSVASFLSKEVANPLSALLVSGERTLSAELPVEANARAVLTAIGTGEVSFSRIQDRAGLSATPLDRALRVLVDRGLIRIDTPLATRASHNKRYRIIDPYLRFWLAFLADQISVVESGRADLVLDRVTSQFTAWRGRAVEPVIRDLLWRSRDLVHPVGAVGGWWNRTNSVEVDIVGADRAPVASTVSFIGSIKWRERAPFGVADLAALDAARSVIPGASHATLVAISRTGSEITAPELITISPDQLVGMPHT